MFTRKKFTDGNVGARIDPKRGRDVCLFRLTQNDESGPREFTLYLSLDEAERLADSLDELLAWTEEQPDKRAMEHLPGDLRAVRRDAKARPR